MSVNKLLALRLKNKSKLKMLTLRYITELSRIAPYETEIIDSKLENITDEVAKYIRTYISKRNHANCSRAFSFSIVTGLNRYGDSQLNVKYADRESPLETAMAEINKKILNKVGSNGD